MSMKWRVINESPMTLCIGSFGIHNNMQARLQVPAGQTREFRDQWGNLLQLSDGDRVFVAWDDFTDEVKSHHSFPVKSSLGSSITLQVFNDFRMDASYS